jgi:hypothetical protein
MKQLMWKREGFLDSLTFGGYPKVAILEQFTINQAQTLIEARSLA